MSAETWFERQMEKALKRNCEAMFGVPRGDSHLHAFIKGEREGLEKALKLFQQDPLANTDKDDL